MSSLSSTLSPITSRNNENIPVKIFFRNPYGRTAGSVKNLPTPNHLLYSVKESEPVSQVYGKTLVEQMKQMEAQREDKIVVNRIIYDRVAATTVPLSSTAARRHNAVVTGGSVVANEAAALRSPGSPPLTSPRRATPASPLSTMSRTSSVNSMADSGNGEEAMDNDEESGYEVEEESGDEEESVDEKGNNGRNGYTEDDEQNDSFHDESEIQVVHDLPPYYRLKGEHDTTLLFESRFESGNLRRATQVFEFEYDLRLNYDVNTRGHTQWFYFSVRNMRKGQTYKFNIVNLLKPDSLFNYGMQPAVYSEHLAREHGIGWHRDGFNVSYYTNTKKRENGSNFRTLTWSYECKHDDDIVYFAHCYPYTYTDMQRYLHRLEQDPEKKRLFTRTRLCESLAGNRLDLLTITEPTDDPEELSQREGVVLSARIHPGESNASWMMKGALDWLLNPHNERARQFRKKYVTKVVPMINVDGVINGNYRCSLAACDLNRRWKEPNASEHPEVFYQKKMMREFGQERKITAFVDFHGHSRKKNIFMYGCTSLKNRQIRLAVKVFPKIVSAVAKNHFSFTDCSFNLSANKDSTARMVAFQGLGIRNSFTLEASFCGPSIGSKAGTHFSTFDLERMGHRLCYALLLYADPEERAKHLNQLELMFPRKITTAGPPKKDFFPEVIIVTKDMKEQQQSAQVEDAGDTSESVADQLRAAAMAQQIEEQEAEGREDKLRREKKDTDPVLPKSPQTTPKEDGDADDDDDDEGIQNEEEQMQEVEKFVRRRRERSSLKRYPLSPVDRLRMTEAAEEESTFSLGSDSEVSDHRVIKTKRRTQRKVRRVRGKLVGPARRTPVSRLSALAANNTDSDDTSDSDALVAPANIAASSRVSAAKPSDDVVSTTAPTTTTSTVEETPVTSKAPSSSTPPSTIETTLITILEKVAATSGSNTMLYFIIAALSVMLLAVLFRQLF